MNLRLAFVPAALLAASLHAAPAVFDFKDPKGVNNVVFQLDAPLESINGTAHGISGTVTFDPENPGATTGTVIVDVESAAVPNPSMLGHLRGARWMDVAQHPQMSFLVQSITNIRTEGNVISGDAVGRMTIKGISREMTVPVRLTYLPGRLRERGGVDADGDILVVRSQFVVRRSDFDINAGQNEDKVANEMQVTLSLAGLHVRR
jgi:polyisoprenoid-binding protein YceI